MSLVCKKKAIICEFLIIGFVGAMIFSMQGCAMDSTSTPLVATHTSPATPVHTPLISATILPEATQRETLTPILQDPTSTLAALEQQQPELTGTLPFFSGNDFRLDIFFLTGIDDNCMLPCWYGLTPEESTKDQVEARFFDLFSDYPIQTLSSREDTLFMTKIWKDLEERNLFVVRAYINPENQKLVGIDLSLNLAFVEDFETTMSPQFLLQEFGEPEEVLIDVSSFVGEEEAIIDTVFRWDNGMGYRYARWSKMSDERTVQLCLDSQPQSAADFTIDKLFIFASNDGLARINESTREKLFGQNLDLSRMESFQDVFGISVSELTSLAQEQSGLCLTSESVPLFKQ